jgi:hypothetical protein
MKIIKILLKASKNMSEGQLRDFLVKNMPKEILTGLEYDDPKMISRALKLLGVKEPKKDQLEDKPPYDDDEE